MKFKIFWLIFILALAVLAYFAFPIIKERYLNDATKTIEIGPKAENIPEIENGVANQDTTPTNEPIKNIDATGTLPNISAKDCDNECQNFKNNAKNLTYCQEVCGFSLVKNDSDCVSKTNLEKDYCLKNLGIAKKDFKICDQIQDAGIKKTCQNRITEDIIESQTN
jgi:hypothetical protein